LYFVHTIKRGKKGGKKNASGGDISQGRSVGKRMRGECRGGEQTKEKGLKKEREKGKKDALRGTLNKRRENRLCLENVFFGWQGNGAQKQ